MIYTPQISSRSAATLRRMAWALKMHMTKTLDLILEYCFQLIDKEKICQTCQDKTKCEICAFGDTTVTIDTKPLKGLMKKGNANAVDNTERSV